MAVNIDISKLIWYYKKQLVFRMMSEQASREQKWETALIDGLVPQDHLLRKINQYIDFSFINEICRPL